MLNSIYIVFYVKGFSKWCIIFIKIIFLGISLPMGKWAICAGKQKNSLLPNYLHDVMKYPVFLDGVPCLICLCKLFNFIFKIMLFENQIKTSYIIIYFWSAVQKSIFPGTLIYEVLIAALILPWHLMTNNLLSTSQNKQFLNFTEIMILLKSYSMSMEVSSGIWLKLPLSLPMCGTT